MKKRILATLLSAVLMLQVFSFTAFAADVNVEVVPDNDSQSVTVTATGLEADSEVSLLAYVNETIDENIDYINQYTSSSAGIIADEDGGASVTYLSRIGFVSGDKITVLVNGVEGYAVIGEETEATCAFAYDYAKLEVTATFAGLPANSMVSFRAYYDDVLDFDYLDQYTVESDGTLVVTYPSSQPAWANGAVIKVIVNTAEFTDILVIGEEPVLTATAINGVITVIGSGFASDVTGVVIDGVEYAVTEGAFTAVYTVDASEWINGETIIDIKVMVGEKAYATTATAVITSEPVVIATAVDGVVTVIGSGFVSDVTSVTIDGILQDKDITLVDGAFVEVYDVDSSEWVNGETEITVVVVSDGVSYTGIAVAEVTVIVQPVALSVKINTNSLFSVKVRGVGTITATTDPADATNPVWKSMDETILRINTQGDYSCTYSALKAGITAVYATCNNADGTIVSAMITVRVNP